MQDRTDAAGIMVSISREKKDTEAPDALFLPLSVFHFNYIYLILFHLWNNSSQITRHLSFFCACSPSPASPHYALSVKLVDGVIYVKEHHD